MRRRLLPLWLALLAYALAFAQRPGKTIADTKVDLHVAPWDFLAEVVRVWSVQPGLGHVFAAQYSGYAWPMGPFFGAGDTLGLPAWIVHRLWLGTLLALAAWGVVRLLDRLSPRPRGALHVAAATLFIVNPYVVVYLDRTSITLLAYAALPWLLLFAHRSVREPRAWLWPAAFALVLTSSGGGVNVAVTGWLLLGPALLIVYERVWAGLPPGALRPALLRLAAAGIVAQLWWVVPVMVQAGATPSFLAFTEQPGTIWGTTSLPESLRLMGFWTSYVGVGYGGLLRPFATHGGAMLFLWPVVIAGLLVPAAALAGVGWTRRWPYIPFFLLLLAVGLVVMAVGWPDGTPLRRAVTATYYRVEAVQFLRTTYKAGALTALALAVLGGASFAAAWDALGRRGVRAQAGLGVAAALLVALASWPLVTGRAPDRQLAFDVPQHWRDAAAEVDRGDGATRTMVLPGQLFASYTWGQTIDPILPTLTGEPVVTRWIVPFSDRRATELQFLVDALVTQGRLRPGQLGPLLDVLGVGTVALAADGDRSRSGEAPAAEVARTLAGPGGLRDGWRALGADVPALPAPGSLDGPLDVPVLRLRAQPTGGIVRVIPRAPMTVVDGGAAGLTGLAAFGALDPGRPLAYAPDLGADGVRRAAADGGRVVIADGNRRRAYVASRPRGQTGPTLPADEAPSIDGTMLDPFFLQLPDTQTVAVLGGDLERVSAPGSPQVTQFPEQRPFAALDGDPSTAWLADRTLAPERHVLTVRFRAPRDVPWVDVLPYSDARGVVEAVEVDGRRFDVGRGWSRLQVGLRDVRELRVRIADVETPDDASGSAGGLRELRIPGVRASEALRPPVVAADALRGQDLRRAELDYLLERTTADTPQTAERYVGDRGAQLLRDAQDPERRLARLLDPPAARTYGLEAWTSVDPRTSDAVLDGLLRTTGALQVTSSSRYEGRPSRRGSGAFDRGGRAWIGQWIAGRPAWLAWRTPAATTLRSLRLTAPGVRVRRPTAVRLVVDGRRGPEIAVGEDGLVTLPAPVRGRAFRLDVLAAAFPAGTPPRSKMRRAVGIGELSAPGLPAMPSRGPASVALGCDTAVVRVGGTRVGLGGRVDAAALDGGEPVLLRGCATATMPAERTLVQGEDGPLRPDLLRLRSAAPDPVAPPPPPGKVVAPGDARPGEREDVRLALDAPAWLVLGEAYDPQWQATCDGRDLGEPSPMQGYANAWQVEPGCTRVDFRYRPQRLVTAGFAISGVAVLVLLLVVGVGVWRRRGVTDGGGSPCGGITPVSGPTPDAVARPWRRALAPAAGLALVVGLVFGLRAGAVALPVLLWVLIAAPSDKRLSLLAGGLLGLVVPAVYLGRALFGDDDRGGYSTSYANDRILAHWAALLALGLLAVVLVRALRAGRLGSRRR